MKDRVFAHRAVASCLKCGADTTSTRRRFIFAGEDRSNG